MTTFSISVPVGAYHELMPTCLSSLASQKGPLQVALLDASGDPRVAALADGFAGLFAYRRHGPDAGQSAAIIEGWEKTGGEILGWLNADDFLFPGAIEKARAEFLSAADVDVVAGHSAICDEKGRMTGYHWAVAPPDENLRAGCVISQPSCFFRRDAYEKAGGLDRDLHYTMDWDLWLRLLESGARFRFIDEALSVVYWGAGTKTLGLNAARRRELFRLIEIHTPPGLRFRARRGFVLRAFLDELKPRSLSLFLEDRLRRKTPHVFGLGPRGAIDRNARLFWTHYDKAARARMRIETTGAGAVEVRAGFPDAAVRREGGAFIVDFQEPVPAGCVAEILLRRFGSEKARLVSCAWL
ncbi:MAG: glycosyltransferase [Parvularculaceae bacterium]|nr:glycosyltransferase [Parvularculaceae bacterium]